MSISPHWFPICVRSQRELEIAQDLRAEGRTVFVPTEIVISIARTSRGSKERRTIRVLAPGYVFATQWHCPHKHAYGAIAFDGQPARIPHMAMLPLFAATGREVRLGAPARTFAPGDIVKLSGTAYDGHTVKVVRKVGSRIEVEAIAFGGPRLVRVEREQIAA